MQEVLLIVVLAGLLMLGGSILVKVLIPRALIRLGGMDTWWSPIRRLPPPGEMYIIVRGSPDGPFRTVIESVKGYKYSNETKEFKVETEVEAREPESYFHKIGVTWVGFNRYLLWRQISYDKWEMVIDSQGKPTGKWGLVPKVRGMKDQKGNTPSIFFRYNMAVGVNAAETIGNFPVNAVIVITAQLTNPVKALFFAGGWESQTTAAVQGKFRKYVSSKRIEDLRKEREGVGETGVDSFLATEIKALSSIGQDNLETTGLFNLYGVEIIDARFVEFDLVTGDTAMTDATRALEVETLKAAAAAKRGDGQRQERENRAAGVRAEVRAWGADPVGATVAMAEAIKEAKPNVLGAGVVVSAESKRVVAEK